MCGVGKFQSLRTDAEAAASSNRTRVAANISRIRELYFQRVEDCTDIQSFRSFHKLATELWQKLEAALSL